MKYLQAPVHEPCINPGLLHVGKVAVLEAEDQHEHVCITIERFFHFEKNYELTVRCTKYISHV